MILTESTEMRPPLHLIITNLVAFPQRLYDSCADVSVMRQMRLQRG